MIISVNYLFIIIHTFSYNRCTHTNSATHKSCGRMQKAAEPLLPDIPRSHGIPTGTMQRIYVSIELILRYGLVNFFISIPEVLYDGA